MICTAVSVRSKARSIPVKGSGWQSGISSQVRFAAWMPATWATANTSPFFTPPLRMASTVSGLQRSVASATAVR